MVQNPCALSKPDLGKQHKELPVMAHGTPSVSLTWHRLPRALVIDIQAQQLLPVGICR